MSTFALLSTILEKSPVETSKLFNALVMERVADLIDERRMIIAEDLASEDPDEDEDFVDTDEDGYELVDDDDFENIDFDEDDIDEETDLQEEQTIARYKNSTVGPWIKIVPGHEAGSRHVEVHAMGLKDRALSNISPSMTVKGIRDHLQKLHKETGKFNNFDWDLKESFQGPRGLAPMKPKVKFGDREPSKKPRDNYDRTKRTVKEDSDYAGHKARVRRLEEPVAGGEDWGQVKYPISSPADKFDENKPVKAHWYIGQTAKHTRHPNLAAFKAHHAAKNGNHVVGVWNA